jgi:hypothetical protein
MSKLSAVGYQQWLSAITLFAVMAGLDPAIHELVQRRGCPEQVRA